MNGNRVHFFTILKINSACFFLFNPLYVPNPRNGMDLNIKNYPKYRILHIDLQSFFSPCLILKNCFTKTWDLQKLGIHICFNFSRFEASLEKFMVFYFFPKKDQFERKNMFKKDFQEKFVLQIESSLCSKFE